MAGEHRKLGSAMSRSRSELGAELTLVLGPSTVSEDLQQLIRRLVLITGLELQHGGKLSFRTRGDRTRATHVFGARQREQLGKDVNARSSACLEDESGSPCSASRLGEQSEGLQAYERRASGGASAAVLSSRATVVHHRVPQDQVISRLPSSLAGTPNEGP